MKDPVLQEKQIITLRMPKDLLDLIDEEAKQEEPEKLKVKEEKKEEIKIEEKKEINLSENASSVLNKVSNKTTMITQNTTVKNESTTGTFFEKEDSK